MVKVLLGIGSNINREENITSGLHDLLAFLAKMKVSPVYETTAMGFAGDDFYNLAVSGFTSMPLGALACRLRKIEIEHGREPSAKKYSPRTLDIDILTYGSLVGVFGGIGLPRYDITDYAFVLKPLAYIEPHMCHPKTGERYCDLWRKFQHNNQNISLSGFQFDWPKQKCTAL